MSPEAFVEVGEDRAPCGIVAVPRLFIEKTRVCEAQLRAGVVRGEFDGDDRLSVFGGSREPGQFDEAIALQPKEPTVVGMALPFEVGLEEEGGVDFGFHQHAGRSGEPAVELFGPGGRARWGPRPWRARRLGGTALLKDLAEQRQWSSSLPS
jgi:hypothetical protein